MKRPVCLSYVLIFLSCSHNSNTLQNSTTLPNEIISEDSGSIERSHENEVIYPSETMSPFESMGLVDVQKLDSRIQVDLKYATIDNFTGTILYDSLKNAYLQPDIAGRIVAVQSYLDSICPGMRLLIYDAARPASVQQKIYDWVKGTPYRMYVANPERTGLHNYAAAVDLTICDSLNNPLDMGTPFDYFGRKAGICKEDSLILSGLLTQKQVNNRRLLRKVMLHAGFQTICGEWWHFNACSLSEAKKRYKLIETESRM